MKKIYKKKCRRKGLKAIITGGLGKCGPYLYAGIKGEKRSIGGSIGGSIGTKGGQVYVSTHNKKVRLGMIYNLNTKSITPKVKIKKKRKKKAN